MTMTFQRRPLALGGLVLICLGVGLSILLWVFPRTKSSGQQGNSESEGGKSATRIRVQVVYPEQGGVERTVTRPGVLHPFQYAELFGKVSGFLHDQKVDIGYEVKKGQLLARIYAPEIEANLSKAKADLTRANTQVDVMLARLDEAKADEQEAKTKLEETQADVESAIALHVLRNQQYHRIKMLWENKAIEKELVDERREAVLSAEASERATKKAVATAKTAVVAAKAHVARSVADLADAKAQVKVAQAEVANAQAFEEYTWLRSPYNGVVTQRNYHEGDLIRDAASSGQGVKPVLVVARVDLMRVVVWVPNSAVRYVRKGREAVVRLDGLPGQSFKVKVARIAKEEDRTSRTMRTEIDLPNPKGLLTAGMYGNVTIYLGKTETGLTIPSASLTGDEKDGKRAVFVVEGGKAKQVTVQVGLDDGVRAEILSGLKTSDRVIVQHDPGLITGAPVTVVAPPQEPSAESNHEGPH
jgi:HlyD family secretion protein